MTVTSRKYLIALDGSENSLRALSLALPLIRWTGNELHSVSVEEIDRHNGAVFPLSGNEDWTLSRFAPAIRHAIRLAAGVGVALQPHVLIGHEVKAICEFIATHGFELLIIGKVGVTAYKSSTMGGSGYGLVQHAPCPVLVIP